MGRLIGIMTALVVVVAALAIPSVREKTGEPCRAFEKLAVSRALLPPGDADEPYRIAMRQTIANSLMRERRFDGHTGRMAATTWYGGMPSDLACATAYWEIMLIPGRLDPWLGAMWRTW